MYGRVPALSSEFASTEAPPRSAWKSLNPDPTPTAACARRDESYIPTRKSADLRNRPVCSVPAKSNDSLRSKQRRLRLEPGLFSGWNWSGRTNASGRSRNPRQGTGPHGSPSHRSSSRRHEELLFGRPAPVTSASTGSASTGSMVVRTLPLPVLGAAAASSVLVPGAS